MTAGGVERGVKEGRIVLSPVISTLPFELSSATYLMA